MIVCTNCNKECTPIWTLGVHTIGGGPDDTVDCEMSECCEAEVVYIDDES